MKCNLTVLPQPEITEAEKWRKCVDEQIQNIAELSRTNPQIVRDTLTFVATMLIDVNNIVRNSSTYRAHIRKE